MLWFALAAKKKNEEKRRKILAESGIKGIRDECKNWAKVAENYIWVTLVFTLTVFMGIINKCLNIFKAVLIKRESKALFQSIPH